MSGGRYTPGPPGLAPTCNNPFDGDITSLVVFAVSIMLGGAMLILVCFWVVAVFERCCALGSVREIDSERRGAKRGA
jgi:hypothetical protein